MNGVHFFFGERLQETEKYVVSNLTHKAQREQQFFFLSLLNMCLVTSIDANLILMDVKLDYLATPIQIH